MNFNPPWYPKSKVADTYALMSSKTSLTDASTHNNIRQLLTARTPSHEFGIFAIQGMYLLSKQPSLVPLMAINSEFNNRGRRNPEKLAGALRWSTCGVLFVWVASLLCFPLLKDSIEPLFIVGDISLFWYVMISPPSYDAASFIVTVSFSAATASLGVLLILRLGRNKF